MIGTDIIEIKRIEQASKNPAFIKRVFVEPEINYIVLKNNSPQTIAGLFAAKEAVIKALGGTVGFKDIIISHSEKGVPKAVVGDRVLEVSISHCKEYATAVALFSGEDAI